MSGVVADFVTLNGSGHMPAPRPVPDGDTIQADVAEVLSPSQMGRWADCQASWYFKYICGLEETTDGARALGRAIHRAAEGYFRAVLKDQTRLDLGAVDAMFREALALEFQAPVILKDKETQASLEAAGGGYVAKYMAEVAHTIEPAAVEVDVAGRIGGVPVRGRIDILDTAGRVIDIKTSSKSPSGVRQQFRMQLATYSLLTPKCNGSAQVDTIVKSKTPKIVRQEVTTAAADREMAAKLYPLVRAQMQAGLYAPNRESYFCSRQKCSFWSRCESEFGGRVAE